MKQNKKIIPARAGLVSAQKGITLIALVITIIILLILAGVAINLVIGENGIINHAKTSGKKYQNATNNEQQLLKEFTNSMDNIISGGNGSTVEIVTSQYKNGVNLPNVSKIAQKTYVTWELNKEGTEYVINDTQTSEPDNWYDYENGKWANIKTSQNGLNAYWVWIPRYEYIVPTSTTATQIEVKFIPTSKTEADEGYTIHPAFTNEGNGGFGDLDGIWVAKYEASSNTETPEENYGGGNVASLKVQVIPGVSSWRNIETKNIFSVCRKMTSRWEVLAGSTVDSHMMKNTEWGAVAILSQSKYGIFNPRSTIKDPTDGTSRRIWNNPSNSYITGSVGNSEDDKNESSVNAYNSANGPKASTTGTIYGVYDMVGGSAEMTASCLLGAEDTIFGVTAGDEKYVDLYKLTTDSASPYREAKIGDATEETKGWNGGYSTYFTEEYRGSRAMRRGNSFSEKVTGIFSFMAHECAGIVYNGFRVVLVP